jgi:hypothetical protein
MGLILVLCLASVPLAGGSLGRLGDLRLRVPWLALTGIGLQVLVISIAPRGLAGLHEVVHMASYGFLGAFGWVNRRVPGVPIVLAGGALNVLVIALNGGVMPADPDTIASAAEHPEAGAFLNSVPVDDARLGFLGDVLATPASLPLHNVYSPGDVIAVIGLLVLVHVQCRRNKSARHLCSEPQPQNAASSLASPTGSS